MYVKLFAQLMDSTVNELPETVRLVWIYLLLLAEPPDGIVDMTIPAIARRANLPIDAVRHGIECLMLPDPESRSGEEGGRRVVAIRDAYGWRVVNFARYSALRTNADRRDYWREYRRNERARKRGDVHTCSPSFTGVTHGDGDGDGNEDAKKPTAAARHEREPFSEQSTEMRLATLHHSLIAAILPTFRQPNLQKWAAEYDRTLRLDARDAGEVERVLRWALSDPFWSANILSPSKLREKFDTLALKAANRQNPMEKPHDDRIEKHFGNR